MSYILNIITFKHYFYGLARVMSERFYYNAIGLPVEEIEQDCNHLKAVESI